MNKDDATLSARPSLAGQLGGSSFRDRVQKLGLHTEIDSQPASATTSSVRDQLTSTSFRLKEALIHQTESGERERLSPGEVPPGHGRDLRISTPGQSQRELRISFAGAGPNNAGSPRHFAARTARAYGRRPWHFLEKLIAVYAILMVIILLMANGRGPSSSSVLPVSSQAARPLEPILPDRLQTQRRKRHGSGPPEAVALSRHQKETLAAANRRDGGQGKGDAVKAHLPHPKHKGGHSKKTGQHSQYTQPESDWATRHGNISFSMDLNSTAFDPALHRRVRGNKDGIVLDRWNWPSEAAFRPIAEFQAAGPIGPVAAAVEGNLDIARSFFGEFGRAYLGATEGRRAEDYEGDNIARLPSEWRELVRRAPVYPEGAFGGRGIVIPGGGVNYIVSAWVSIRLLRYVGCSLPIELWVPPSEALSPGLAAAFQQQGVRIRSTAEFLPAAPPGFNLSREFYSFRVAAAVLSGFEEAVVLDADVHALGDLAPLFGFEAYRATGLMVWKDYWAQAPSDYRLAMKAFNVTKEEVDMWHGGNSGRYPGAYRDPTTPLARRYAPEEFTAQRIHAEHSWQEVISTTDSGIMVLHKRKIWEPLMFHFYMSLRPALYYKKVTVPNGIGEGDKEALPMAMKVLHRPYYLVETPPGATGATFGHTMVHYAPNTTQPLLLHRTCWIWRDESALPMHSGNRTWDVMAHVPPTHRVTLRMALDIDKWPCSVTLMSRAFVKQPFVDAVPFDVEAASGELAKEIWGEVPI